MINVSKSKQIQFSAQWHTTTSTEANNLHYLCRRLLIQISTNITTLIAYDLKVNGDNKSGPFTFQRGIKHKVLIQGNLQGWVRLKWIINKSDLNATKSHNTMPLIKNIYAANKLQGSGLFDAVVVHNKTSYQVDSDITMGIWRELIQSNIRFHGMARNWSDNGNSQGCLSGSQKHTSTKPVWTGTLLYIQNSTHITRSHSKYLRHKVSQLSLGLIRK